MNELLHKLEKIEGALHAAIVEVKCKLVRQRHYIDGKQRIASKIYVTEQGREIELRKIIGKEEFFKVME